VLYEFASLAFPELGQGDGSDSGKYRGMENLRQGVLAQIAPALRESHAGIYVSVRGDRYGVQAGTTGKIIPSGIPIVSLFLNFRIEQGIEFFPTKAIPTWGH